MTITPKAVEKFMQRSGYSARAIADTVAGMRGFTGDAAEAVEQGASVPVEQGDLPELLQLIEELVSSGHMTCDQIRHGLMVHAGRVGSPASKGAVYDLIRGEETEPRDTDEPNTSDSVATYLRSVNNANRREFNQDEIIDGTVENGAGKTGSIVGNSSKTGQVLDPGTVWAGNARAPTADEMSRINRQVRERTNDAIAALQQKQQRHISTAAHPHSLGKDATLADINRAQRKAWGVK